MTHITLAGELLCNPQFGELFEARKGFMQQQFPTGVRKEFFRFREKISKLGGSQENQPFDPLAECDPNHGGITPPGLFSKM